MFCIGIGLAAFGILGPLLAAFMHMASEMTFILNSAPLLPSRSGKSRAAAGAGVGEQPDLIDMAARKT